MMKNFIPKVAIRGNPAGLLNEEILAELPPISNIPRILPAEIPMWR